MDISKNQYRSTGGIMTNKGVLLLPRGFQGKNKLLILGCLGQIALNTGNSNWNTSGKEALFQFSLMVWRIHSFIFTVFTRVSALVFTQSLLIKGSNWGHSGVWTNFVFTVWSAHEGFFYYLLNRSWFPDNPSWTDHLVGIELKKWISKSILPALLILILRW